MELPISDVMIRHKNPDATADLIIPVHIICNTPDDVLIDNITKNSRLDKEWLKASEPHKGVAVICGSGPSIADDLEQIKQWNIEGATIFALNGCAKFLAENGIMADYQVMCDARPDNVQLIGPAVHHLFASQCHPSMFEAVPDAILWHLQIGDIESYFPEYEDSYMMIGGAASVGNTATCLAYGMGF
ncbi:MAG TPA: 6-hydroxymethylpterin diphosphokinase MptE-like protein, partial [Candidatus Paceibacterota bacterium]